MRWVPEQGELSCSVPYHTSTGRFSTLSRLLGVRGAAALEKPQHVSLAELSPVQGDHSGIIHYPVKAAAPPSFALLPQDHDNEAAVISAVISSCSRRGPDRRGQTAEARPLSSTRGRSCSMWRLSLHSSPEPAVWIFANIAITV
uniref:Uncharacterized protein n=1 Tax=Knipowitschia caucasica TaxID=637954 RepID=A0AAV2MK43_KNICA